MAVQALREFHTGPRVHFISNVDGAEILSLVKTLNAASTLVVVSSKTFTTAETLINAQTAIAWLETELDLDKSQSRAQCIAITNSRKKALAFGIPDQQILTFPDSIGADTLSGLQSASRSASHWGSTISNLSWQEVRILTTIS